MSEGSQHRVTIETIDRSKRGSAALIGIVGLCLGTLAVFESANQAGTVALLTVGAVSTVFAILGKLPLRWVVGGTELDMSYEESRETADALAEVLSPKQLQLTIERLLASSAQQPASTSKLHLAANLSRASTAEVEGHSRMKRFATLTEGWSYEPASSTLGVDGIMTAPGGVRIGVDFKAWGDGDSRQRWHQRIQVLNNRLPTVLETAHASALLVLVDATDTTEVIGEFPSVLRRPIRVATFGDGYGFLLSKFEELRHMAAERDNHS